MGRIVVMFLKKISGDSVYATKEKCSFQVIKEIK